MKTRLFRIRQPAYRYVLFSYGGKAVKRRGIEQAGFSFPFFRNRDTENKEHEKKAETVESQKIIDYATLLSWYNENKSKTGTTSERMEAQESIRKQRELKFLML